MRLVERDVQMAALAECLAAARRGDGRLVLVAGEAGIGKTALVERFRAEVRGARVLTGACDPLGTPRPLGPIFDIAEALGAWTDPDAEERSRDWLFRRFHQELASRSTTTVVVIEDAHWADAATLDLLRFVGRRLRDIRGLIVVTLRDDDAGPDHPLRVVMGDLATSPGVVRIELSGLSRDGVGALAGSVSTGWRVDVDALHASTGGNPFFVTEVLAGSDAEKVPTTVRDAVLARVSRLPAAARVVTNAAAVVPTRVELWLLRELTDRSAADIDIDAAVASGVLRRDVPGTVAFRHELARLAVDETLPPAQRAALHATATAALLNRYGDTVDPARLAHHAELAGDGETARSFATRAARTAAELGAHREAYGQYERALRHAEGLTGAATADLWEGIAPEALALDKVDVALDATTRAVALRRRVGDPLRLGGALREHSVAQWSAGHSVTAAATGREAVEVLQTLDPGPELADAYAQCATTAMLARDHQATLAWGARAVALAERVEAPRALARTLNSVGSSKLVHDDGGGVEDLRRSIAVAEAAQAADLVCVGWSNLGSGAGEVRRYDIAEEAAREAIRIATDLDLDANLAYITAWLARVRFELGEWSEAESLLAQMPLDPRGTTPITRIVALGVRGRMCARRGDDGAAEALSEAWQLATETGDLQRLWPIAAARAEHAWLDDALDQIAGLVDDTYQLACELDLTWAIGELGIWRWRAGIVARLPDRAAKPYALHVRGRLTEAAMAWNEVGCPYEAADALADSTRPDELLQALEVFDGLGATRAAVRVRRTLRAMGVRHVPRGPRPSTSSHPAGLTRRQSEVLTLVALGLRDAEIAGRLHISTKTAAHHVSAILSKLGASSRTEAVHLARARDLPDGTQQR